MSITISEKIVGYELVSANEQTLAEPAALPAP